MIQGRMNGKVCFVGRIDHLQAIFEWYEALYELICTPEEAKRCIRQLSLVNALEPWANAAAKEDLLN